MDLLKKLSLWLSIIVLLILCGATVYVLHRELAGQDIWGTLLNADPFWFALAVLAMILYFITDGMNIARPLRISGHKISFGQMLKYSFAGFFFSSITPSSTGGQPGQLYFMAKDGIKVHSGAFSLLCTLLSFQIISVSWGIVGAFFAPHGLWNLDGKYSYVFPIGFILNLAIIVTLACVLFSRKMACFFAWIYLKLPGKKASKPGDRYASLRSFAGYRRAAKVMRRNKVVFLKMLLNSFVQITLYFSVPFLCARALGADSLDWFSGVCTQGALFLSVSSLPLPGAAGVTEYGYALFFDGLIPSGLLGSALLLSRFCNFVLPLAESGIGMIVLQLKQKSRRAIR